MWCIIYLYKKRGTGWELEKGYGKGVGMREGRSKFNCVGIREGCSEECGIRVVAVKGVGMREVRSKIKEGMTDHKVLR